MNIITSADSRDSFVLMGDFNLYDSVIWSMHSSVYGASINGQTPLDKRIPHELFDLQALCNLKQLNFILDGNGRTLDLVDGKPLKYLFQNRPEKTIFYRANYEDLNYQLSLIDWDDELNGLDINGAVRRFYEILEAFIDKIRFGERLSGLFLD